jgi:hypothetical protein
MAVLASAIYQTCQEHFYEFICLDGSWPDFVRQGGDLLAFLMMAHAFDPDNRFVMEYVVAICQHAIQGVPYVDEYDTTDDGIPIRKVWSISQEYERHLGAVMGEFVTKLTRLDPTYQPPTIKKASTGSGCFVATATMGVAHHSYCVALRSFRDNVLEHYAVGRWLIEVYYRHAPSAALVIARCVVLKTVSRLLLIRPMVVLCGCIERIARHGAATPSAE